jgi:predicted dehydrogenase
MTKRIGFVDYNLQNYHANVFVSILNKELAGRGYSVSGCTALLADEGRAWGEKNNVPYFESVAELNQHVDYYAVLAPSNPEVHLDLCKQVLPFGKATYVDKTFAPSLAVAEAIFALADKHGAGLQTTSALRYTNVQAHVHAVGKANVLHMVAWGNGSSFGEYAIHPTELVLSCLGAEATSVMRRGSGPLSQLLVNFSGGRTAVIHVYIKTETPFAASVSTSKGTTYLPVDSSRFYVDLLADTLDFFDAGKPTIDRAESLMIRRILDAAERPEALQGFVAL